MKRALQVLSSAGAVVCALVVVYYALPVGLAVISLGEICPYSPLGTHLCATGDSTQVSSQEPVPSPSPTGALCTDPGRRYEGSTRGGGDVCFTLSSDRGTWLEIGFRFAAADGCPGGRTGTVYIPGALAMAGAGRIAVARRFSGSVGDDLATGVLQDSEICGSKQVPWTARLAG